jgi:hypothetical protein
MAEAEPRVEATSELNGAPAPEVVQPGAPGAPDGADGAPSGSISALLEGLSADDLRRELRARVDEGGTPREGLRDVDSADIARQLTFLQRQVYRPDEGQDFGIFGKDDRLDLFQVTDFRLRNDADCVVLVTDQSNLTDNLNGTMRLKTYHYGTTRGMCVTEPFWNQTTVLGTKPAGSGFLVAPNVVATAGHCIDAATLPVVRFVFGYQMQNATAPIVNVKTSDVYRGVALIGHQFTPDKADWALVLLDRQVPDHQIASVRRSGRVPQNARLHVIGHPVMLPLKVAGNAVITSNTESTFFQATLDAFGGNSGSPVFNSLTHEVEGILVRGYADFQSLGACQVSMVYPDTGAQGNHVNRSTQFASLLGPGWQQLDDNRLTTQIAASGSTLYQLHSNGELFQYTGTPMVGWAKLDNNPLTKEIAAGGGALYQRHSTGQVWRYTGVPMTGWALIDSTSTAKSIMALGGKLYKRHSDGSIFRYTGTPLSGWQQLDNNPLTVQLADDGTTLYQLHSNGQLYRYTGTPMVGWALIDNNPRTKEIVASGGRLYQRHSTGEIFQYMGTPMTGWARLDSNGQTAELAADGLQLYQRHHNGQIYRYTGVPMSGWAVADSWLSNPARTSKTIVAAGGQLYQRHATGSFGTTPVVETCAIRRAVIG